LIRAIRRLARQHLRFGYKRIHARLVHQVWKVNRKCVRRLWNQLGLRRPKPRKTGSWPGSSANSCVKQPARFKNDVWTYDFVMDRTGYKTPQMYADERDRGLHGQRYKGKRLNISKIVDWTCISGGPKNG
jgi:hypothetical protein